MSTPTNSPTPTATPALTDAAGAHLGAALEPLCHPSGILSSYSFTGSVDDYAMSCVPSAGHQGAASIHGYASVDEAMQAFDDSVGANPCLVAGTFRGLPAAMCEMPFGLGGLLASWVWRDGCWLVRVSASDDTDFLLAPDPSSVSKTLFDAAAEIELFSTCPTPPPGG